MPRRAASLWLLVTSACVVPVSVGKDGDDGTTHGGESESTGSVTTSGTSEGPGGDGTGTGTGLGTDSGDTGTDSGDTGTDSGDTGDTGLSVCDPQPEFIGANIVRLDEDPEPLGGETDVDSDCEVLALTPSDSHTQLDLECESGPLSFTIYTSPATALPLTVGETLHTRMREFVTIDRGYYLYLSLADLDGLRLGFVTQPYEGEAPPDLDQWLAPLSYELDEDVCDPEPFDPPEPGRTFILDPCPHQEERVAIDVLREGEPPVQLLDQTRASAHGYDVWVSRAVTITYPENPECGTGTTLHKILMLAEP